MNNEHYTPAGGGVMRSVCRWILMALTFLGGCAKHDLRCDAHLTPVNPPEPPAARTDLTPSERDLP